MDSPVPACGTTFHQDYDGRNCHLTLSSNLWKRTCSATEAHSDSIEFICTLQRTPMCVCMYVCAADVGYHEVQMAISLHRQWLEYTASSWNSSWTSSPERLSGERILSRYLHGMRSLRDDIASRLVTYDIHALLVSLMTLWAVRLSTYIHTCPPMTSTHCLSVWWRCARWDSQRRYQQVLTSMTVFVDGRISTRAHLRPHAARYSTNSASVAWRFSFLGRALD